MAGKLLQAMLGQSDYPCSAKPAAGLRIRCAELHTYDVSGGLMSRGHRDRGSVLTMSVLLSDRSAMDGGEFLTWDAAGAKVVHDMDRGDAVLFHSEKTHNVATVTRGVRYSLVIELWEGPENTYDRSR